MAPPPPPHTHTQLSPNCALVLQSMLLVLVHKSLTLCNSTQCRDFNVRGIVLSFGYKKYKWEWWYMPLRCRLQSWVCRPHASTST